MTVPEESSEATAEPAEEAASPPPIAVRRTGWRRARITAPTQEELDGLQVKDRLELLDRRRQSRHQTLNSIGILFGVVFTAGSLIATALSVRTTQNELRNGQQGQITDRYTKAVEQLGSPTLDIRLGGIYALERLAIDSPRDDRSIYDVLTAFTREHDPKPAAKIPDRPTTDIQAALTIIGRRKPRSDGFSADLDGIRVSNANLFKANLSGADLDGAKLYNANFARADLTRANLDGTDLTRASLTDVRLTDATLADVTLTIADLSHANLARALLYEAALDSATLTGADLTGADLLGANLRGANLRGADLARARLTDADLRGADLSGANLSLITGMTPDVIRAQVHTDSNTSF
ncbi:pentapeptide repeat-containing protein [Actinomadura sp. DC4]|uniref:pentapeptide repeat-containing protein n=1 Tax=Actinomadura sp. DC4 TaxID=3055069 RepID=UPI0025B2301B|nr:pentapeptide repeat-containing protein [Actinomadura sp. DC4]MDN3357647.1 pentapeptide repeat-containing protein [Actinomadura sp. DC4]